MKKLSMKGVLLSVCLLFCAQLKAFQFQDSTGKIHQLTDYKGRWVIVNFWATWCPPCLKEIPDLIALHGSRKDIVIARSLTINYPIVLGNRKIASQIDEISLLPSTYFYDPDGEPAARQLGIISRESIEQFIAARTKQAQK